MTNVLPVIIQKQQQQEAERMMSIQQYNQVPANIASQDVQQTNPFATDMARLNVPDVPIQYAGGMSEVLLGDREIPEQVKDKYWWIFNKDNVLTFLDEDRKKSKLLNFDIIKIDNLNSIPYYDYDFNLEKDWDILRNSFETKLDRALGFKGQNVKNERIVLQSQFSENRMINDNNQMNGGAKEGFFRRLLGRK